MFFILCLLTIFILRLIYACKTKDICTINAQVVGQNKKSVRLIESQSNTSLLCRSCSIWQCCSQKESFTINQKSLRKPSPYSMGNLYIIHCLKITLLLIHLLPSLQLKVHGNDRQRDILNVLLQVLLQIRKEFLILIEH